MDYKTKGTTRKEIRFFAKVFRDLFDIPLTGAFPVLEILDRIPDVFENCYYTIVSDDRLDKTTMAACTPNEQGGFTIEIKESVYKGAYENNNGACRGFILHEVCHVFLFNIGYTPLFERAYGNKEVPSFCSVEWQATHNGQSVMINSRTAAKVIKSLPGYKEGQPIRLLACNVGARGSGFAQNLANKLGVTVYAPNNYLWAKSNGTHFIAGKDSNGKPDRSKMGKFVKFTPGGNKR